MTIQETVHPDEMHNLHQLQERLGLVGIDSLFEHPNFTESQIAAGELPYDIHHADTAADIAATSYNLPRKYTAKAQERSNV